MPILPKYRNEFTNNGEREIFNHAVNSGYFNNLKRYFIHSLRNQNIKGKVVGEVDFVYLDENYIIFLESKGGTLNTIVLPIAGWFLEEPKRETHLNKLLTIYFTFEIQF